MSVRKGIAAATVVMATATFLSRIAGLLRDMVIARLFGAAAVTDAFFMAFTLPNLLRRFFAEGSLTAAFVPIYAQVWRREDKLEAQRLANRCVTLLLLLMLFVVAAGVFGSPWLVKAIGYGFGQTAGKLQLTDQLNRMMFPYIALVSLLALITGILNVRGHFFFPSLSPLFLNLTMIVCAVFLSPWFAQPIYALAVGVVAGGVIQLLLQIPVLYRYRIRFRPDFSFRQDPDLKQIARLMLPGIAGVAIYQINIVISRLLASFLPDGSLSWLYYGQRLFEFPQGIFIVSLAQAVLPLMSRQLAEGDEQGVRDSLSFSMALVTLLMAPAVIGLLLCATPVYALFFMGGEFNAEDLRGAAIALICYAPGLLFVGYSRIAAQTFYAYKDTRTPVLVSFWTLLVNLTGGLLLMQFWGYAGLALALTLSTVFNAALLLYLLQRKSGRFIGTSLFKPLLKAIPACLLMALVVRGILSLVVWEAAGELTLKALVLLGAVGGGAGSYLLVCYLLRVDEVRQGLRLLRRRS